MGTSASRPAAARPAQFFADAPQKILGRLGRVHLGVDEPDQVAEEMVAKDRVERLAALPPAVWTVETVHGNHPSQGPVEDPAIGRGPFKTQLGGHREDLVGDRTLGGPQPRRRRAELARHVLPRQHELAARIVGVAEPRRQRHLRMRHGGDVRIAQQRQNRMVIRGGRNLDLARAASLRYTGSTWPTISRCFSPMRRWSAGVKSRPRRTHSRTSASWAWNSSSNQASCDHICRSRKSCGPNRFRDPERFCPRHEPYSSP